ncbi:Na+/H+ antiporter subunit E [Microbacterium sp. gxy059]|uniref:Na+/H+ antiporter subunit E n=1 Tax=Microbacterium sp. gxy059 TaxID=2957199 RepID=UPI003D996313
MIAAKRSALRRFWVQLPFSIWLVILWMLLWGQFTWLAAITGVAVAAFVTAAFRLPSAELSGRVNPWRLLIFVVAFLLDLVRGALEVAWEALTPNPPYAAVIRVPLKVDDDLLMTHVAVTMSLVPGSTVVEADRENRILYLHAIRTRTMDDVERVRRSAWRWEKRIALALGSRQSVEDVRRGVTVAERRAESVGGAA